jgi:acetyl-CoA carboxylase carboxyl transferase subunit alpha
MDTFALPFEEPIREIEEQILQLRMATGMRQAERERTIKDLQARKTELVHGIFSNLSPWDRVRVARHPSRPTSAEYVNLVFDEFIDLHGDRRFGDDKAIMGGFASLNGERLMFLGQQKGRTTKEKLACNFGMPHPEGYRKALRIMRLAEKFQLPVVTFIDTMGAYPGIGSEERGVAEAIAVNLMEMSRLRTPFLSIVIGEGGSGGALGLGTGDRLLMCEFAYYSVISPEGCAAILWRSGDEAPRAAAALRLTARDLQGLGIVDDIIEEPEGGAHADPEAMVATLRGAIIDALAELRAISIDRLLEERYDKYRRIGYFMEGRVRHSPLDKLAVRTATAERRKARRAENKGAGNGRT